MGAGAFPWPICPPKSLQYSLCDDETVYTSIEELYDHSFAVHLPKPSPVSLLVAPVAKSLSVSIDDSTARGNNAGSGGCPDCGQREERQTDSAQVGRVEDAVQEREVRRQKWSARRRGLPRGLEKEARRLLRQHHTADGHHHQAVSEDRTGNEVTVRSHLRHDHHGNGARRGEEHEGTDASVQRGRPGSWQTPHTGAHLRFGHGEDEVRSCEFLHCRSDVPIRARSRHSGDRSGVRDPVVSALQSLGAGRKYGRAPPTQLSRELQQWLDPPPDK